MVLMINLLRRFVFQLDLSHAVRPKLIILFHGIHNENIRNIYWKFWKFIIKISIPFVFEIDCFSLSASEIAFVHTENDTMKTILQYSLHI